MSTIFEVKTAENEGSRYVEATSRVDAFTHVAGDYFAVTPVKAAGLRELVKSGAKVETTKAVAEAAAKTAAAGDAAAGGQ